MSAARFAFALSVISLGLVIVAVTMALAERVLQ